MAKERTHNTVGQWDIPERTFLHLIKTRCASCLKHISYSVKRYEQRGNWCQECENIVNYRLKHGKKLKEEEFNAIFR